MVIVSNSVILEAVLKIFSFLIFSITESEVEPLHAQLAELETDINEMVS